MPGTGGVICGASPPAWANKFVNPINDSTKILIFIVPILRSIRFVILGNPNRYFGESQTPHEENELHSDTIKPERHQKRGGVV